MKRLLAFLAAALAACGAAAQAPGYAQRPEVRAFIGELAARHGFVEKELLFLFSRVRRVEPVLQAIAAPRETSRSWQDYRASFVNARRIAGGVEFWKRNRRALERAEREFGVPPQYVVAIIGVETDYGRHTGRWRVVDALTTLAFDYPPRAAFFRGELEHYLLLARDTGIDVFSLRGSYAGAMGIPQFMPGSARRYAVDFDGDGAIELGRSNTDAIGSVANYLQAHGWQRGGAVFAAAPGAEGTRVELDGELRVGLQNFYVLTRYNRSAFYASAVADLAQELREAQILGR